MKLSTKNRLFRSKRRLIYFFTDYFANKKLKNKEKHTACAVADYIYPREGGSDNSAEKGNMRQS